MYKHIKSELLRREISFRFEEESFNFQHPKFPDQLNCIISEDDGQMCFIADFQLPNLNKITCEQLCLLINNINYDNNFGNLETDGNDLVVFKLNTFLLFSGRNFEANFFLFCFYYITNIRKFQYE